MIRTAPLRALAALAALAVLAPAARAGDAEDAMYGKALDFLLEQQQENGGFGQVPGQPPGEVGITALVLKALADAPEAMKAKGKPAAEKAAAYLVAAQQPNGSFSNSGLGLGTYRTSLSILALGAYDRAKYAEAIKKGADWLKKDQFDEGENLPPTSPHHGGFGYDEHKENEPAADMSNSQLALAALHDAGVGPEDPVFQRALIFIKRCQNNSETNEGLDGLKPLDDGGFMYDTGRSKSKSVMIENPDKTRSFGSYASMTYAGLQSMVYAGLTGDDPCVQAARGWISQNYTLEENKGLGARNPDPKAAQQGLYYYYNTFAKCLAAVGEPTIETAQGERHWAKDLFAALASRQRPDGSWTNEAERWWEKDPVLVTAYCLGAMNNAFPFLTKE